MTSIRRTVSAIFCLTVLLGTIPAAAIDAPDPVTAAEQLAYDDPGLYILNYYKPLDALPLDLQQPLGAELSALGVPASAGFYDLRANRWGSLILSVPLVPGSGVGNDLAWSDLGLNEPEDSAALGRAAKKAFESFLATFSSQLRIDPEELGTGKVTVHDDGRLVQINVPRVVGGVPVDGSWVHGVVNSGNLVLFGTRNWGDIDMSEAPAVSEADALTAATDYVAPSGQTPTARAPRLKLFPMKNGDVPSAALLGAGFDFRLAWEVQLKLAGSHGTWRALVDAHSGEVFSFADQNRYATRKVTGGVQPVSNDGLTVDGVPDGQEQDDWPMPFADIWIDRAPGSGLPDAVTNSGGVLSCVEGSIATRLAGPLVRMNDNCGATNESVAFGDLDLGSGATASIAPWMPPQGTDCARPLASSSNGNTHSSRDGFYEVNRIKEMARAWLPENFWLTGQLTANMNINNTCNAFWNGTTINFYRDANSGCRNTGEIAAVFDHEWGHGMDANDAVPGISFPGETIADQYAMFRLNTSCIGRGFFKGGPCSGQGDACLECTGVRETDWTKRASGRPHNITWIKQPVVTPVDGPIAPRGGCVGAAVAIPALQTGPCLQSTHCEGSVVSEAVWDLMHRDLNGFEGSPFNLDENTRINLVTRLGYLGGGNVNFWYQCVDTPEDGTAGCNADGGYLNFLAVDDDNGDLFDGTPHMSAIHDAFARHQMACPAPIVADAGCSSVPETPTLTVTALDNGAQVNWTPVAGATEYWLFRADGINGCEFGKERVAITSDTQFVDSELLNGRPYYYTVEAIGGNDSCRSSASECREVTPVEGANLKIKDGSISTQIQGGDGDAFLDNCETALVSFELENNGNLPLTNVQIVSIESPSHPGVGPAETLPIAAAASLTDCATAPASFSITADGLSFGDTLVLRVGFTADELAGVVRTETIEIGNAESDFSEVPSHTFDFNSFSDLQGWELVTGNYDQLPGGPPTADPSGFFLGSSAFLPDQCDAIQSPLIKLTPTSTLSLWNQYDTEPPLPIFGGTFYDRANVGILDTESGLRTTIVPDGGRLYDIPAGQTAGGSCFTANQRGWSDIGQLNWAESTWSAGALGSPGFAGDVVRLHVAYGTDPLVQGAGFQFDYVTVTDFAMQGPDQQPDLTCEESFCGDGIVDAGEECDDGNNTNGDGCSSECTLEVDPVCGDGNLDAGEECDDGNNTDGDGCSATCEIEPFCGDGVVDPGEECDDGNNRNGDGCSSVCTIEESFCGDGVVDPGEECDDGNNEDGDGCSAICEVEPFVPCDYCAVDDPVEFDLTYLGGDCSNSNNTQGSKAECTDYAGPPPSDQPVYIIVSNKSDADADSDDEFFRGEVDPNQAFMVSAAFAGKNDLPSKVFVHIFIGHPDFGGVLLQTNEIHTSCSAPMIEGERFGAVQLGDANSPGDCPVPTGGRVHGSGFLDGLMGPDDSDSDSNADSDSDADSDSEKVDFSFDAKYKSGELKGKLKLRDKEIDVKIDAKTITSLSPGGTDCNGVVTSASGGFEFTAIGEFNGIPGAQFRVCGEDNGKPGKGDATHPPDRFYLECTLGCSYDTASRTPDDGIDGGNIHLHDPIGPAGGGSGFAEESSPSSDPEVIDLDPILLSEAVAGAPQVMTAVLSTPSGLSLGGRELTLRWETPHGQVGSTTALTDALGTAIFTVDVVAGEARYWVEVDGLESNAIALDGIF